MFNQQDTQNFQMNKLRLKTEELKHSQGNIHQLQVKSIGLPRVWLPQSNPREHAVVAGLSPLQGASHLEELLQDTHSSTTLSNNSWLALLLLQTIIVMVEECTRPSHMLQVTHSRPLLTIHSQLLTG